MYKIEVLGSNCSKCDNTFDKVKQVIDELKLEAELTKITDVFEIIEKGVNVTPALIVDGKIKFQGRIPSFEEIKKLLTGEEI
jgi:small redox-active disulfide protein 2